MATSELSDGEKFKIVALLLSGDDFMVRLYLKIMHRRTQMDSFIAFSPEEQRFLYTFGKRGYISGARAAIDFIADQDIDVAYDYDRMEYLVKYKTGETE